jgi:hypothetical protein
MKRTATLLALLVAVEHVPNSVEIPCGSRFTLGNLTFGVN